MQTDELLEALGYAGSTRFLLPSQLGSAPEHAHIFKRAMSECAVRGVYLLREDPVDGRGPSTPILYVADAGSAQVADEIHRRVWNQNIVPFLMVRTPSDVRLYSGFEYRLPDSATPPEQRGVLEGAVAFGDVLERLYDLTADSIDNGTVWRTRGKRANPAARVDWLLLENLKSLGEWLHGQSLDRPVAHALIGKFVYLRYLRDRGILSDRKLADWGVETRTVFGREATLRAVRDLVEKVDGWLNGSIFPLSFSGKAAPTVDHVRRVAGVFLGDDPLSGQLHLDFRAYDFSHIPIETLSVIYEQFLAVEGTNREKGAYYTPVPLVNFMLAELDELRPLEPGMTVLDPACGSGAFLVQCYRRLVERHLESRGSPRPALLRDLLVKSIFGIDRDLDACRVAALSLTLAMLDYITPPDLQTTPQFKLPDLLNRNIFEGDFFDSASRWAQAEGQRRHDWIVGNPPWVRLGVDEPDAADRPARAWIAEHAQTAPVVNNDVAEAFAWKVTEHVADDGAIGLLLPAMTLLKDVDAFRARFFQDVRVAAVANLSNLRRDLFRKAETPAAAFFYSGPRRPSGGTPPESVLVFSPLVANQEAVRTEPGARQATWAITLEASEVRSVSSDAIREGSALPWKVAMWGSPRDLRLLRSLGRQTTLKALLEKHNLVAHAGLELRSKHTSNEPIAAVDSVIGKPVLDVSALKERGRIYLLPADALRETVPADRAFARKRGGIELPLSICKPPHIIVSGARTFAVFSNEFVVVPSRQIGIAGDARRADLLKALALFLNSDFVTYHQFFTSPQGGIRNGRSTLDALMQTPAPLEALPPSELRRWVDLHGALVAAQQELWRAGSGSDLLNRVPELEACEKCIEDLETKLNEAVAELLELSDQERCLVRDLVHVRSLLSDGRVSEGAVGTPAKCEQEAYARRLERELNDYIGRDEKLVHQVTVVTGDRHGMVQIELRPRGARHSSSRSHLASPQVAGELKRATEKLVLKHGQWLYFDRNLFLYQGDTTFILKPLQRVWWTESQALSDADDLVAEALAPSGTEGA